MSMNQSASLVRGRSPPPRFLSEPHSTPSPSSSTTSSPSPPHHPAPSIPHTRHNYPLSHHRPAPIVTSGFRDSSLPSRLSYLRSDDRLDSVSSLAYSDMDASPAVNFLSAFADATIPSIRAEMSPIPTVPSELVEEGDQVAGYMVGQIIGRGGFSVVREARHPATEQRVAVKIVRRAPPRSHQHSRFPPQPVSLHASISSRDRSSSVAMTVNGHLVNSAHLPLPTSATEDLANALLKQEIRVWSSLSPHPNLVPLLSLHETPTQTLLFMPMCEGGNLLQLLNQVKLNPHEQDKLYALFAWPSFTSSSSPPLGQSGSSSSSSSSAAGPGPSSSSGGGGGLRLDLGLTYLHNEAGIVHKDIKLENILIQQGQIKISDFGLATYPSPGRPLDPARAAAKGKASSSWNRDLSLPKTFSALPRINEGRIAGHVDPRSMTWSLSSNHTRTRLPPQLDNSIFASQPVKEDDNDEDLSRPQDDDPFASLDMFPTAAGSLAYTPPEQLRSETPLACPSLDIWALGCVLYGLLEGHLPFQDDFEPRLRLKIMNGQFDFPAALVVSPADQAGQASSEAETKMSVAKVLQGCLAVDRNSRWVVSEIGGSGWLARPDKSSSDDGRHRREATTSDDSARSVSTASSGASGSSADGFPLDASVASPTFLPPDCLPHDPACLEAASPEESPLDLHALLVAVDPSPSSPPGSDRPARPRRRAPAPFARRTLLGPGFPVPRTAPPVVGGGGGGPRSLSRSRSRTRSPFCANK
ncbi:serine/threonine protein kinase [Puccinia triticina 1-1 BBBD Race 1]|uniref:Protein kinase domain-containing protein n=1 Tax=Puccinia triticina (isolate 1-1 / race 1 (BBBD)) TaxID=630390 RepID=A0A180G1U3_PUCT1|nr:serine/threonine protein kinase [Puccinia triticina 1-1 BBBD Race 1]